MTHLSAWADNSNSIYGERRRPKAVSYRWHENEIGGLDFQIMKRNVSSQAKRSFPKKPEFKTPELSTGAPWPVHVIQIIFPGPWAVHAMQICSGFKSPSTGISGSMCIQTFSQSHFIGTYVRIWPKSHATTIIKSSKVRFFENRSHGISAQRYADK